MLKPAFRGCFDTLAQSGTNNVSDLAHRPGIIVYGNGTDHSNSKAQQGKAKRKYLTQWLARCLAEIALEKGNCKRAQQYWNSWHCYSRLIKANGRTYGNYCKTRCCLVCLANRKADIINRYYPTLCEWEDPHFVTLTVKAVKAHKLNKWIREGMVRGFGQILARCRKRYQRGTGPKLIGIKSLECNYNPIKKTYNPHFHILVPNREIAEILKAEWQQLWTKKHTCHKAQYIRRVGNLERDLVEIIKYGSKIFTEPDMKKRANSKIPPKIYAAALDTIFVAMKGHRLFDRFGFNLDKTERRNGSKSQIVVDYEELSYDPFVNDWLNYDTGELLTGYQSTAQLQHLLSQNIDKEST